MYLMLDNKDRNENEQHDIMSAHATSNDTPGHILVKMLNNRYRYLLSRMSRNRFDSYMKNGSGGLVRPSMLAMTA